MTQAYIIIDMQNDFIDGALGNAQAQAIVPKVEAKIVASKKDEDQETDLIFTQDTHGEDYSETQEGRKLPIPHCIKDTRGWRICKQLLPSPCGRRYWKSHPSAARPWSTKSVTTTGWSSWACAPTFASSPMP